MDASKLIDAKIKSLPDWRGKTLADIRRIVPEAVPDVTEEWKWMGTPTWSREGILCIANAHKDKVKVTFSKGAMLPDPDKIFNNGLGGNVWRAIDLSEGDKLDEKAFKNVLRAAVAFNLSKPGGAKQAKPRKKQARGKKRS